jgi:hypothetical protein
MIRSPLSDFNRRRSLFDSPNFVRFITKTLHSQSKPISYLDSTTSSASVSYCHDDNNHNNEHSLKSAEVHRLAVTRKLTNMNEQSPLQLNRGNRSHRSKI